MLTVDQDNETSLLAADFIHRSNVSVFLTGKAGSGKTTFLKQIKEKSLKNLAIVAPTGVAAMNAGGTTIHSFFQLPFTPFHPEHSTHFVSQIKFNAERREILQHLELLVIDEISMVRADVLDAIDTVLRSVRSNSLPFGGVQLLYIGDMYQLPPVVRAEEWTVLSQVYNAPFFFCSQVFLRQPVVYIELQKIYRQRDERFISLLNKVRNNDMDQGGYDLLNSRLHIPTEVNDSIITLTTHNAKADAINNKALSAIYEKEWCFNADIEGIFPEPSFPVEQKLLLKLGAQVMFIKNDIEKVRRYYNGKIGTVNKIESDKIWVEVKNENQQMVIELKRDVWRNIKYTLNKSSGKIEEEELGKFEQYPLRLAWAITIHKSQGLTFEKVIIDAEQAFSPGQVYVALSRCTSLEGLYLQSSISYSSLQSDSRIVAFSKSGKSHADQLLFLTKASEQFFLDTVCSIFTLSLLNQKIAEFNDWIHEAFGQKYSHWINQIKTLSSKLLITATKFQSQLEQIYGLAPVDMPLFENRVSAACEFFKRELQIISEHLNSSPVVTDNRDVSIKHDNSVQEIYDRILFKIHMMSGFKKGYTIEIYYQQKAEFKKKKMASSSYSGKSSFVPDGMLHPLLYTMLKEKRGDLCNKLNVPVYMICSSASIEQMSSTLPTTLHALGNINGFGKVKLKQFGKEFIEIISDYCKNNDLEENLTMGAVVKNNKKRMGNGRPGTREFTFNLFKNGKKISEIANERKLTVGTIENHLLFFVADGKLKISDLLNEQKINAIAQIKNKSGSASLSELKQQLPEITYNELRWYLAAEKINL